MIRVLILYGTTDGHTRKVSRFVAVELQAMGILADVVDVEGAASGLSPEAYDGVIVAASVHAGGYQRPVLRWVRTHAAILQARQTAFLSVCLAVLQSDPKVRLELEKIEGRFVAEAGWQPAILKPVAGAILYTRYNLVKRWIMRRIAKREGGGTDTSRDYEYTDWADLAEFSRAFGHSVAGDGSVSPRDGVTPEPRTLTATGVV